MTQTLSRLDILDAGRTTKRTMADISSLFNKLNPDSFRSKAGFTREMETANNAILAASQSDAERVSALAKWLTKFQPCFFCRMAAGALDILNYCVLTDGDIANGYRHIRDKIAKYRLHWRREALLGRKRGFVILAASERPI